MNKKIVGSIATIIGILILIVFLGIEPDEKKDDVFHVTLADSSMYKDGVFSDSFEIEKGIYQFEFVPNGDSPQMLTISLTGPNHNSIERFELVSESHETGISQYFTWSYLRDEESEIIISSTQDVQIIIDPHGSLEGPVSVFLKKIP